MQHTARGFGVRYCAAVPGDPLGSDAHQLSVAFGKPAFSTDPVDWAENKSADHKATNTGHK